jgi:hypothetical protein
LYRVSQDPEDISGLLEVIEMKGLEPPPPPLQTKPYLAELCEYIGELSGDPGLVAENVHGVQLVVMKGWIVPAKYLVL